MSTGTLISALKTFIEIAKHVAEAENSELAEEMRKESGHGDFLTSAMQDVVENIDERDDKPMEGDADITDVLLELMSHARELCRRSAEKGN